MIPLSNERIKKCEREKGFKIRILITTGIDTEKK